MLSMKLQLLIFYRCALLRIQTFVSYIYIYKHFTLKKKSPLLVIQMLQTQE